MLSTVQSNRVGRAESAREYDASQLRNIDAAYLGGYCDGKLSIYITALNTGFPQLRARISTQQSVVIDRLHEMCGVGRIFDTNGSKQLIISARNELSALCTYIHSYTYIKCDLIEATLRFCETQDRNENIRRMLLNNPSRLATRAWELHLQEGIKDLYDIALEIQSLAKGGK